MKICGINTSIRLQDCTNTTEVIICIAIDHSLEIEAIVTFKEKASASTNLPTIPPSGVLKTAIPLVTFEDCGPDAALHFLCHHGDTSKPRLYEL